MTDDTFKRFLERIIPNYAAQKVQSGQWTAVEAQAKSAGEYQRLLPDGLDTPKNFLYDLHDLDLAANTCAANIGELWYGLRDKGTAYVYEVEIAPDFRRRGYATQAFELFQHDAVRHGASNIQLHVFGHNAGARALYEGLGFFPTSIVMRKDL